MQIVSLSIRSLFLISRCRRLSKRKVLASLFPFLPLSLVSSNFPPRSARVSHSPMLLLHYDFTITPISAPADSDREIRTSLYVRRDFPISRAKRGIISVNVITNRQTSRVNDLSSVNDLHLFLRSVRRFVIRFKSSLSLSFFLNRF